MERPLLIPVRIVAGKVVFAFGKQLPKISDGARAELIVSADHVADKYLVKLLQTEQCADLLAVGARVLIGIRPTSNGFEARRAAFQTPIVQMKPGLLYFEAFLEQPLGLRLTGARRPSFVGGACTIPALDHRRAISLNQAFTFLSERFESDRESHVGNAFKTGIYHDEQSDTWHGFEDARTAVQTQFADYLTEQANVKGRKRRLLDPLTFAEWIDGKHLQAPLPF